MLFDHPGDERPAEVVRHDLHAHLRATLAGDVVNGMLGDTRPGDVAATADAVEQERVVFSPCRQVLGKGNRQLIKYAPPWAFEKLQAWLDLRRQDLPAGAEDDPFLFNRIRRGSHITRARITKHAIYYIARQRGAQVGVKIMPHDFRRAFITRVIEEHDLSIAQKLAHHANIQTTAIYDRRDDNERRRAVDRFDY